MKNASDVYQQIADDILEAVRMKGFSKWMRCWVSMNPQNGQSGHVYRGMNTIHLSCMMMLNKWEHPFFMTFNNVKAMKGRVLKGEKSTIIYWWKMCKVKKDDPKTGEETVRCFPQLKTFNVFNIAQTDINPEALIEKRKLQGCKGEKREDLEAVISETGANIAYQGSQPCYIPARDLIECPPIGQFHSEANFYATMFHELAHWTKGQNRTDRAKEMLPYNEEELVAEFASAFLCNEYGIEGNLQHVEYIASWEKGIKDDPKRFFQLVKMAEKAATFIKEGKKAEGQKEEAA